MRPEGAQDGRRQPVDRNVRDGIGVPAEQVVDLLLKLEEPVQGLVRASARRSIGGEGPAITVRCDAVSCRSGGVLDGGPLVAVGGVVVPAGGGVVASLLRWRIARGAGAVVHDRLLDPTTTRSRAARIVALLQVLDRITESRKRASSVVADFRELARRFAAAPTDDDLHRLWSAAFGLGPARHAHLTHPDPEPVASSASWPDAPAVPVSGLLRGSGQVAAALPWHGVAEARWAASYPRSTTTRFSSALVRAASSTSRVRTASAAGTGSSASPRRAAANWV